MQCDPCEREDYVLNAAERDLCGDPGGPKELEYDGLI